MVLTKYFSLYRSSISPSKKNFIFKSRCLSGSDNPNLHLEILSFKIFEHAKINKYYVSSYK